MDKKVFIIELKTTDIEKWKEAMTDFLQGFELSEKGFESKLVEIWTDIPPD